MQYGLFKTEILDSSLEVSGGLDFQCSRRLTPEEIQLQLKNNKNPQNAEQKLSFLKQIRNESRRDSQSCEKDQRIWIGNKWKEAQQEAVKKNVSWLMFAEQKALKEKKKTTEMRGTGRDTT